MAQNVELLIFLNRNLNLLGSFSASRIEFLNNSDANNNVQVAKMLFLFSDFFWQNRGFRNDNDVQVRSGAI